MTGRKKQSIPIGQRGESTSERLQTEKNLRLHALKVGGGRKTWSRIVSRKRTSSSGGEGKRQGGANVARIN